MTVVSLLSDELSDRTANPEVIDLVSSSPPQRPREPPQTTEPKAKPLNSFSPPNFRSFSEVKRPATSLGLTTGLADSATAEVPLAPSRSYSSPSAQFANNTSNLRRTSTQTSSLGTQPALQSADEGTSSHPSRDSTPVELASRLSSAKEIKDRITAYLLQTQPSEEEQDDGFTDTIPDEVQQTVDLPDLEDPRPGMSDSQESLVRQPGSTSFDAAEGPKPGNSRGVSPVGLEPSMMETDASSTNSMITTNKTTKKRARPVFKDRTIADLPDEVTTRPAVAAASITDRRKAARCLQCQLWTNSNEWMSDLKQEFENLETEVELCRNEPLPIEGAVLVAAVHGTYEDVWSHEHQTFVKSAKHDEDLGSAIIVLKPEFMDKLGKWDVAQREQYFVATKILISAQCCQRKSSEVNIIFMIPELGIHYTRQVDKFNRDMRRRIAIQSQNFIASTNDEGEIKRPDEQFYANLESELQIIHQLRAHYPRKRVDCVEMITNCVMDFGLQRYNGQKSQLSDSYGGSVRSKVTLRDVCIESLTQIQGLPPRIATSLIDEAPSLGKLLETLGTNAEMRNSRIKRFGKGNWNASLLKFLQCDDPTELI